MGCGSSKQTTEGSALVNNAPNKRSTCVSSHSADNVNEPRPRSAHGRRLHRGTKKAHHPDFSVQPDCGSPQVNTSKDALSNPYAIVPSTTPGAEYGGFTNGPATVRYETCIDHDINGHPHVVNKHIVEHGIVPNMGEVRINITFKLPPNSEHIRSPFKNDVSTSVIDVEPEVPKADSVHEDTCVTEHIDAEELPEQMQSIEVPEVPTRNKYIRMGTGGNRGSKCKRSDKTPVVVEESGCGSFVPRVQRSDGMKLNRQKHKTEASLPPSVMPQQQPLPEEFICKCNLQKGDESLVRSPSSRQQSRADSMTRSCPPEEPVIASEPPIIPICAGPGDRNPMVSSVCNDCYPGGQIDNRLDPEFQRLRIRDVFTDEALNQLGCGLLEQPSQVVEKEESKISHSCVVGNLALPEPPSTLSQHQSDSHQSLLDKPIMLNEQSKGSPFAASLQTSQSGMTPKENLEVEASPTLLMQQPQQQSGKCMCRCIGVNGEDRPIGSPNISNGYRPSTDSVTKCCLKPHVPHESLRTAVFAEHSEGNIKVSGMCHKGCSEMREASMLDPHCKQNGVTEVFQEVLPMTMESSVLPGEHSVMMVEKLASSQEESKRSYIQLDSHPGNLDHLGVSREDSFNCQTQRDGHTDAFAREPCGLHEEPSSNLPCDMQAENVGRMEQYPVSTFLAESVDPDAAEVFEEWSDARQKEKAQASWFLDTQPDGVNRNSSLRSLFDKLNSVRKSDIPERILDGKSTEAEHADPAVDERTSLNEIRGLPVPEIKLEGSPTSIVHHIHMGEKPGLNGEDFTCSVEISSDDSRFHISEIATLTFQRKRMTSAQNAKNDDKTEKTNSNMGFPPGELDFMPNAILAPPERTNFCGDANPSAKVLITKPFLPPLRKYHSSKPGAKYQTRLQRSTDVYRREKSKISHRPDNKFHSTRNKSNESPALQ